jgi:hypothetical protein
VPAAQHGDRIDGAGLDHDDPCGLGIGFDVGRDLSRLPLDIVMDAMLAIVE